MNKHHQNIPITNTSGPVHFPALCGQTFFLVAIGFFCILERLQVKLILNQDKMMIMPK
jgi:hypothetical protein